MSYYEKINASMSPAVRAAIQTCRDQIAVENAKLSELLGQVEYDNHPKGALAIVHKASGRKYRVRVWQVSPCMEQGRCRYWFDSVTGPSWHKREIHVHDDDRVEWLDETPAPPASTVHCPLGQRWDNDAAGCGSTSVTEPDDAGWRECMDCGVMFLDDDPFCKTRPDQTTREP
jgi:hypothetical protein